MARRVDGVALALIGAGTLFGYAGIKGYSIPATIQDIITGKSPLKQAQAHPISGGNIQVTSISGITGQGATAAASALATIAVQDQGHCYHFGGAPGPDGKGCWDCSSACNWWAGKKAGLAIPGYPAGAYDGSTHGPSSFIWAAWTGCTTIGHSGAAASPGDLCIWMNPIGHMGVAIGGGKMISALDPSQGTAITPIDGTASGVLLIRRLKAGG